MFSIDLERYRLVDISVHIEPPGAPDRPLRVKMSRLPDNTYKTDIVELHSHVGAHVEGPAHLDSDGALITELPLESFFGPAVLMSIDDPADRVVTGEVIDKHVGDIFQSGHMLIGRNGMPEPHDQPAAYPTLTPDAARWMVEHEVKMFVMDCWFKLGADVPAIYEIHEILLHNSICILERTNLADLRQRECFVMGLPVAFALDSSFCRAVALEER